MRLSLIGSPPFATKPFQALVHGIELPVVVVTAPQGRAGRGLKPVPNEIAEAAAQAGVPVLRPESAGDPAFLREFADLRPDLGVVVSYGQILKPEFLAIPRFGCINLHASLLPRWRGASPIQAAILAGDAQTGVTIQRVVQKLDAGAVLARRSTPIGPHEDAVGLAESLGRMGAELLVEFLDRIGDGPLPAGEEQDERLVTICKKVRKEDGRLDWSAPAVDVDRRVRAMAGWPVAETALPDGTPLKVLRGEPVSLATATEAPGTVVSVDEGITVRCGTGAYRMTEIQRPGKAPLPAAAFLRGARLRLGDLLR